MNTATPKRSSRSPRRSSAEKAKMLSSKVKSIRGIVSDDWKPSLSLNGSNSSLEDFGKKEEVLIEIGTDIETKSSKERRGRGGSPNSVMDSHQKSLPDNEEEYKAEEEMQIISCPACGSIKSPEGANFCSHCGHRLSSAHHDCFHSDDGDSQAGGGRSVGSSGSRSSKSSKTSRRRKGPRKPRRSVTIDESDVHTRSRSSNSRSRSDSRTPRQKSSRDVVGTGPTVLARSATTPGGHGMEKLAAARAKVRSSAKMRRSTTFATMDSTSVASEDSLDQNIKQSQRKDFRRSSSFASLTASGFEEQLEDFRKQLSQKSLQTASAHGTQKQGNGHRAALVNAIRSQSCRDLITKKGVENDAVTSHVAKHVNQKTRKVPAVNWRGAAKQAASRSPPRNGLPTAGKLAAGTTILKCQNSSSSSGSISSISYSTGFTSRDDTTLSSMGSSADVPAPLPPTLSRWESGMTNSGHGTKEPADSIPNRPEQDLSSMCSSSVSGLGNGGVPQATATPKVASTSLLDEEFEPETPRTSSGRNKLYPDILFPATPCESTRSGISALTTPTCFKSSSGVGIVTPGSVTDTPNSIALSAIGMARPRVPSVGYEFLATNSTNHVSDLSCSSSFLQSSSSSFLYSGSTTQFSSSQTRLAKFLSTPTIEEEGDHAPSANNKKGDCMPRMVRRHSFDSVSACSALEPSNNNTDDIQPMPPQRRVSLMPTTA